VLDQLTDRRVGHAVLRSVLDLNAVGVPLRAAARRAPEEDLWAAIAARDQRPGVPPHGAVPALRTRRDYAFTG
jgi:hypothetical protein